MIQVSVENTNVGDVITLYSGDEVVGTHTITAEDITNGSIEITATKGNDGSTGLDDGNHNLSVTVQDVAGTQRHQNQIS